MKKPIFVLTTTFLFIVSPCFYSPALFAGFLYGTGDMDLRLFKIDPTDFTSVTLPITLPTGIAGLAYNSRDGFLYGTGDMDSRLFKIDPTDFTCVTLPITLPTGIAGLAYIPEPATLLLLGLGAMMLRRKK